MSELGDLPDRIDAARSIFVLTGSGISAESGLPTFRGVGGLWRTHRVEELASPGGFAHDPRLVWTWYNERRRAHQRVEPSAAHVALAQLEARSSDFTLATQNVDSLHPEETALTAHADRSIRARASDVLPALVT